MNDTSCNVIAELLVEYADGELPADEARRVADHLAGCPDCRAELRLFDRSLDLAREVWHESAVHASVPGRPESRSGRRWVLAAAGLAAGVAVLLLLAGSWLSSPREPRTVVNAPKEVERHGQPPAVEQVDIEAMIAREGRSARLAAAARMLAAQPGLEQYAREAERYLAEVYRGTAAVNGALPPSPSHRNKEPES